MSMNLVDSCGWLEFFADGPNAHFFEKPLAQTEYLIVPSLCIYEVFKSILRQKDEDAALQAISVMRQGRVIDIDTPIALAAAKISLDLGLPLADSIIISTARAYDALIWTQDADFKGVGGVNYIEAKKK
jgi:predicted nucleic acid-binding protein